MARMIRLGWVLVMSCGACWLAAGPAVAQPYPPQGQQVPAPRYSQQGQPQRQPARQPQPRRNPGVQPQTGQPFQLTPQEQAHLDAILKQWQERSSKIRNLKCGFTVWEHDPVFNKNTERAGELAYEAPDKGYYHVQWEKTTDQEGNTKWLSAKDGVELPHWTCDGDSIYEVKHVEKKVIEHQLPEHLKGNAIGNGPLPFMFLAKAEHLRRRYFLRILSPPNRQDGQVWIEAFPRFQQDAANFRRAELILSTKDFLPIGLKLHLTNGKSQTTHVFKDYKLNQLNFFTGVRGIWAPHPFGYEREVRKAPQATARKPESKTPSKPSLFNLFRRKSDDE